jgi:hypothetical protein
MTAVENELRRASFFFLGSDFFKSPLSDTSFVVSPMVIRMLPMTPIPNKIIYLLYNKSCEKIFNNRAIILDHNDGVSGGFGDAGVFGGGGARDDADARDDDGKFSNELLESSSPQDSYDSESEL